jgi:hypothetical protein
MKSKCNYQPCNETRTTLYLVKATDRRKLDESSPIFQGVLRDYCIENADLIGKKVQDSGEVIYRVGHSCPPQDGMKQAELDWHLRRKQAAQRTGCRSNNRMIFARLSA